MSVTYYYADPRMMQGYSPYKPDENSMLDYWFYPDRDYLNDVRREAERLQAEANKKKDGEGKGKGGGGGGGGGDGGGGGGKKGGGGGKEGEGGNKKEGENKEGGEKKEGGKKQPKVVELKVNLCCDACARKLKKKIKKLDGVEAPVDCDMYVNKVTVMTSADTKPETVLKQAQKVKKDAVMWPKKETEKKEAGGGGGGGEKKKN